MVLPSNIVTLSMLFIQFATVIICLVFGSVMDLKKREVPDVPWIIMTVVGIITSIVLIIYAKPEVKAGMKFGVSVGVGIVMGLLLYYTGVMGGADAKAVMALSFNTPVYFFGFSILDLAIYEWVPSIFNTFFNWLVVMIIFYPIPLLFYNLYLKLRGKKLFENTTANFASRILMLISGYLSPIENAKGKHGIVYSEEYDSTKEEWEIKHFMQVTEVEEEEKFKKEVEEKIKETEKKQIWVKVLPPGIVFLLIGYIVNVLVGNLFFLILNSVYG